MATPKQQKWIAKLSGYDYEITYSLGHENSVVNTHSYKLVSPTLIQLFVQQVYIWEEIKRVSKGDAYLS